MKCVLAITVAAAGVFATRPLFAAGSGGFAGGFASGSGTSGGAAVSHGSARSAGPAFARSGGTTRSPSAGNGARAATAAGYRFSSGSTRSADSFRHFSPGSVLPISHGGFVRVGFNDACFAGHPGWNGRRFCFPFRYGSRYFGNGYAYFGSDYLGSDYETKPKRERETAEQPQVEPIFVPYAAPPAAEPPAPAAVPPPPVSREFAYGSIVTDVQNRLAGQGYFRGSIDGYITAGTRTAIAMFQDRHQLVITGRIDAALLQALGLTAPQ